MLNNPSLPEPGLIILFGSGETSPTGRKVFEQVLRTLPQSPRLALLETPAGFELNSAEVIGRVGDFFSQRLQNFSPQVEIIPARRRGTPFSPDAPDIVAPLLYADLIFMGPGSPSYAIRQLRDSLAWYYLIARHRLGSILALASAATVAFSTCALPVYEIYKVGDDLHWIEGLDFFNLYGLQLVFIPHWNNHEGGAQLDTSRCFMGQARFVRLMDMLPEEMTIIGLDEKTALVMDPSSRECQVKGLGGVTLIHTGHKHSANNKLPASIDLSQDEAGADEDLVKITEARAGHIHHYTNGEVIPMSEIGHFHPYHPEASLPHAIWQDAIQATRCKETGIAENPPQAVLQLLQQREKARKMGDWVIADELRQQAFNLGWEIMDTGAGPVSRKKQRA